jgi:beta-xylosidase
MIEECPLRRMEAHGGGIIQLRDTYYWFGEDRTKTNDPHFRYVACYSSRDLSHWQFRNQVVKLGDPENLGPKWVLERPKVFYNTMTHKYVMYVHLDGRGGYKFASIGVLTCNTIDGDYKYIKSFRPLGDESRDIGQFIDDDGSAYLIFEDRPNGFHSLSFRKTISTW